MKLYCNINETKQYLNTNAKTRLALVDELKSLHFHTCNAKFHVSDVFAEPESNNKIAATVIGGFIGLLGGPIGLIIGSLFGWLIGNQKDQEEIAKADRFNNSEVNFQQSIPVINMTWNKVSEKLPHGNCRVIAYAQGWYAPKIVHYQIADDWDENDNPISYYFWYDEGILYDPVDEPIIEDDGDILPQYWMDLPATPNSKLS